VVQLLIPASVWDQSWIRICFYIRLRGDSQRKRARLGVEDGRFYVILSREEKVSNLYLHFSVVRSLATFEVPYQSPTQATVESQPEHVLRALNEIISLASHGNFIAVSF
jgi:hypothetical protein